MECELITRTKALAEEKGLDSSRVRCPLIDYCKPDRCVYTEALEDIKTMTSENYCQRCKPWGITCSSGGEYGGRFKNIFSLDKKSVVIVLSPKPIEECIFNVMGKPKKNDRKA